MKSATKWIGLMAMLGLAVGAAGRAEADVTLTFGPLSGVPNGNTFTGETEQGFNVTPTSGQWFVGNVFGNPVPSIFVGPLFNPVSSAITITSTTGATFDFENLDVSSNNGSSGLVITGSLGGHIVYNQTPTAPGPGGTWTTLTSTNTGLIDSLTILVNPGAGTTSVNLDNIHLSTGVAVVPEPSNLFFGGIASLMGIAYAWRRKAKGAA